MPRPATLLRAVVAVHLVWTFLLTPVALEPRPFSSINPFGWLSLGLIFTTVTLDIVAFVIVSGRPRTAGTLAMIGALLFIPAFVGDQLGLFSTLAAPTRIVILEVAALVTQLVLLYVGLRLRRESALA